MKGAAKAMRAMREGQMQERQMMALALPDPERATIPAMRSACAEVIARREEIIGGFDLEHARRGYEMAKLIERYMQGKEGRPEAEKAARIFEAAIGAALGPAEETQPGPGRGNKGSLASEGFSAIPKDDRHRFRRMAENRQAWEPALSGDKGLSRSKVLRIIDDALQERREFDLGLADVRCSAIEEASVDERVDWIITDPPYPAEHLDAWSGLANFAVRSLKPGGSLLAMTGQFHIQEVMRRLDVDGLRYHWILAYLTPGGQSPQIWPRRINTFWKPVLWYTLGEYDGSWAGDVLKSATNDNDKRFHEWGQSESGMRDLIGKLTKPEDTICDPFCGGGTTVLAALSLKRRVVAFDMDPEACETTLHRMGQ